MLSDVRFHHQRKIRALENDHIEMILFTEFEMKEKMYLFLLFFFENSIYYFIEV